MMYGVMLDCSRNGVMTVEAVKRYAELLSQMGYNTLMLYTEDTYEVDGEPYFGYLRGRYTKREMKELDAFCNSIGVELVPCIQTLAHLNCIFKWSEYQGVRDCDDILLAGEEKTYQLLERMIASLAECFTSRKIHIGMDEAHKVGLGKFLERYGYCDRFDVINRHLHRVCGIAEKFGFEPMLWSDMFCNLAMNTGYYYEGDVSKIAGIREKAALPEKVSLVYWDYYSKDYNHYVNMIKINQAFGRKVYFAGGAWTWKGFAPANTFSMETDMAAMKAVNDCGIDGWMMTVWGDDGNECSPFMVLPSLLYAIEYAKGNQNMEAIKQKFLEITGAEFDTFLLLDALDTPGGDHEYNPSKYLLYNDPFLGINDYRCRKEDAAYYAELTKRLAKAAGKGVYAPYFDAYEKLSRALEVKCSLGIRTREHYKNRDKEALRKLAENDYTEAMERIRQFHEAYQRYWMSEKKPQGFEMQDIRLGGILQRLGTCKNRLLAYADGTLEQIEELEEELLPNNCGVSWARIATPSVISHEV